MTKGAARPTAPSIFRTNEYDESRSLVQVDDRGATNSQLTRYQASSQSYSDSKPSRYTRIAPRILGVSLGGQAKDRSKTFAAMILGGEREERCLRSGGAG